MDLRIAFIGGGQMAQALAQGFVRSGHVPARQITVADPSPAARAAFTRLVPEAGVFEENQPALEGRDVVVLAVKPQQLDAALASLPRTGAPDPADKLYLSIVAGATLVRLVAGLGSRRVVRVMPNTPALVGAGATGYCLGPGVTEADAQTTASLLSAVGTAYQLPESLMDAVTGLSGSGPALVYQVIEALSDGGVRVGLPRDVAIGLAVQTVLGAARMVQQTGRHPAELKDGVASPGGTTIAGLHVLERAGVRGALMDAVVAAAQRAHELSGE
jgi:pyrroline-5-carboxylate reductase